MNTSNQGGEAPRHSAEDIPASDTLELEGKDPHLVAIELGIPGVRLKLIRYLHEAGSASVPQLSSELGCSVGAVRTHIVVLERLGILDSDVVRVEGVYRPTRLFRLDEAQLEEVAWSLFDSILQPS